MGKITINELSDSLKNHIDSKQDATDNLLETNNKTVVGAINELFQNVSNESGKKLIANAIGAPLSAEDTFSEMSNDINGLLSTFKTNMMNNGVAVESGDKFKQLIDKIGTTLTAKGNYNIKFAEGTIDDYIANTDTSKVVETNLDFTPNLVVVVVKTFSNADYLTFTNLGETVVSPGLSVSRMAAFSVIDVSSESFTIQGGWSSSSECEDVQWFAIGIEPSDVSSSTFLNIISAAELPPTGVDNQICVITDEPSDILVTYTQLDLDHSKNDIYCLLGGDIQIPNSNSVTIVNGNVTQKYNFNGIYQYGAKLSSYIYRNSAWELFTGGELVILSNKTYHIQATKNNLSFKPELTNSGLYVCSPKAELLTTKVDLTNYSTAELLFSRKPDMLEGLYFVYSSSVSGSADKLSDSGIGRISADDDSGIADISSLTGSYYIGIGVNTSSSAYGYAGYLMGFKLY